jgi:hypothetical protein
MGITDHMSPWGPGTRRRRRNRILAVVAATGLIVVIAATVLLTRSLSGNGGERSGPASAPAAPLAPSRFGIPSPSVTATATATSPANEVLVLPAPTTYTGNSIPLGFPDTTAGAVSAMVRWAPLMAPDNEDRETDVLRTISTARYFAAFQPELHKEYVQLRPPTNFWVTSTPHAYRIMSTGSGRIVFMLLLALQAGDNTGVLQSMHEADSFSLVWTGTDWRLDGLPDTPSGVSAPDPKNLPAVLAAGWREFQLA